MLGKRERQSNKLEEMYLVALGSPVGRRVEQIVGGQLGTKVGGQKLKQTGVLFRTRNRLNRMLEENCEATVSDP